MKFEFGVAGFAVVVSTVRGAEQWPLSGNIKHQSTVLQHSLIDSCEDAVSCHSSTIGLYQHINDLPWPRLTPYSARR